MSKSKGNGVDPMDLIDKYGTDAVRFTIASFAGETQDVRLPISYECPHCDEGLIPAKLYQTDAQTVVVPSTLQGEFPVPQGAPKPTLKCPNKKCGQSSQFATPLYDADPDVPLAKTVSERFEYGRNFCNKFWNAARFAMLNLEGYTPGAVRAEQLQMEDRWILSRLSTVAHQMDEYLGRYQFERGHTGDPGFHLERVLRLVSGNDQAAATGRRDARCGGRDTGHGEYFPASRIPHPASVPGGGPRKPPSECSSPSLTHSCGCCSHSRRSSVRNSGSG